MERISMNVQDIRSTDEHLKDCSTHFSNSTRQLCCFGKQTMTESDSRKTIEELENRLSSLEEKDFKRFDSEDGDNTKSSFLQNIFESIVHPLYVIDIETHLVKMTNSAARRAGLIENAACHVTTNHKNKPCGIKGLICPIEEVKRKGLPIAIEHIHCDKDGNPRAVEVHGYPVFDSKGTITQLIVYALDITERKNLEEALQVSYRFLEIANRYSQMEPMLREFVEELRKYIDCSTVAIRIIDEKGNIPFTVHTGLNPCFEQDSYHTIDKTQCLCTQVTRTEHDLQNPHFTETGSFFTNSSSSSFEMSSDVEKSKIRCISYGLEYESVAVIPVRVENKTIGLIHIADTENKKVPVEKVHILEKVAMELGAAFQRLQLEEALTKAREEYLSTLTHDMKNPLTSILSSLRLIADPRLGEISEKKKGFVDMTRSSCETLLTMINNIINVSRLDVGEIQCVFSDTRLSELLEEVRNIFEPMALLASITLNIECPEHIYVTVDREKIQEVLHNLIGNAVRYTPKEGFITIRAVNNDKNITISVSDTGNGIPEEYHETIFRKYCQVKGEQRGSGLGLYIVKKFLDLHGSDIELKSTPGKGTEFIFNLKKGKHPQEQNIILAKILLMCDDESLTHTIHESLKEVGFVTDKVNSCKEALSLASGSTLDLIVTCDSLSRKDGDSFLKLIDRCLKENIPVILITGSFRSELRDLVAVTIPLPLNTEYLKDMITQVLSHRSAKVCEI
ncbi:MAG: ATP-binding protein [Candidatus Xenobiia bacterium LiM19]